jgi:hypothetical protein
MMSGFDKLYWLSQFLKKFQYLSLLLKYPFLDLSLSPSKIDGHNEFIKVWIN